MTGNGSEGGKDLLTEVHECIQSRDGLRAKEIAEIVDRKESRVIGALGELVSTERATKDSNGKWHDGTYVEGVDDVWADEPVSDAEPSENNVTETERFILSELQEGTTVDELSNSLDKKKSIVNTHLSDLRRDGWEIYRDETSKLVTLHGDHAVRSSEHKGTRTRKANRWWEKRHSRLVQEFKALDTPTAEKDHSTGSEDWVHLLGDVHAGDKVKTPDRTNVYGKETIPRLINYDTRKSLELAEYHGAQYDTAHLCYLGDMVTNEGIYEGQFEDLDAWLDEQHDMMMEPLIAQIKAFAEKFKTVNVICQVGNHGNSRASGTSRQANADLILYKSLRNSIATALRYGGETFSNVSFTIGQARPYTNFKLRGDKLRGHLRHGDDRTSQATTRKGSDEWGKTLRSHEFDVACMGHHHVSGRIAWPGPPIFVNGTPKPPSDFVDRIAAEHSLDPREQVREISYCFGVADHGVTGSYPVKTHDFSYVESSET